MTVKNQAARRLILVWAVLCAAAFTHNTFAQQHEHQLKPEQTTKQVDQQPSDGPSWKLADLEQLALKNNPTVAQAEAAIRAAEGRRMQAGLWPNPVVGYAGEELAFKAFKNKSEHFFFIEQTIVTAGKLKKSRAVAAQEKVQTEADATSQRLRVLNAVRMLYYEALGAQQLVDLRKQMVKLSRETVETSEQLYNIGQTDRPNVLGAEVEAERAELDLIRAENDLNRIWQMLAALVNDPKLSSARAGRLEGDLETEAPKLNQEELLSAILLESPEIKNAQAGIERARALLARAKAEPKPDIFLRGGIGYSNEPIELLPGKTGPEARVEVGFTLPAFNRNQGNIAAAEAELTSSEREQQRVELSLRSRLADSFNRYLNSLAIAGRYRRDILPRAQQAYELNSVKFHQMANAYPSVLIAQRTLFEARADYISALVELWQNVAQLRGMLLRGEG